MAISVTVRPCLLVAGVVVAVAPRQAYDRDTRTHTDEVIGYTVTVSQDHGAQIQVRYDVDDTTPAVLDRLAVMADVTESREWGASLRYQRDVTVDDLDKVASMLPVKA